MRLRSKSSDDSMWRCDACGAYNDESLLSCSECSAQKLGAPKGPKGKETKSKESKGKKSKSKKSKPDETEDRDFEASGAEASQPKLSLPEPSSPEPSFVIGGISEAKEESKLEEPKIEEPKLEEPKPSFVIGGFKQPEEMAKEEPKEEIKADEPEIVPQFSFSPSPSPATGQTRYYLVFVNTPAQSLIKSKVQIDFDDFPTISIGRSPENVVVIPDQEVSRKHAELTMDGSRLILKDLQSRNGTYLYNGKEFQQVSDSVEVKPNSVVKFGTGTIVRLTSE